MSEVGQEIRDARIAAGLSVPALAKLTNTSISSIKRFEVDPPDESPVLARVQRYLGVGPFKGVPRRVSRADIYALPDEDLVEVQQVASAELARRFTANQGRSRYTQEQIDRMPTVGPDEGLPWDVEDEREQPPA